MTQDKNVPTGEACISQLDLEVSQITKMRKLMVQKLHFLNQIFPLKFSRR